MINFKYYSKSLFFCLVLLTSNYCLQAVDLVIFSYNRPMQLYSFLESCDLFMQGRASTTVIYRSDDGLNMHYEAGYEILKNKFTNVRFVKQLQPPHDFKKLVDYYAFKSATAQYIMFAVDDLFVKAPIDLNRCIDLLQKTGAYTFSLRLGLNIDYTYMTRQTTFPPVSKQILPDVYQHVFKNGQGDWCYPNSVDLNIYLKQQIYQDLMASNFNNPNSLEGSWAARANLNQSGLYFAKSKIVNIPLNIIQNLCANRAMHSYTIQELYTRFMAGQKIDLAPIIELDNHSAHIDYDISFVTR